MCGGTSCRRFRYIDVTGLSPRVRGNQSAPGCRSPAARSIPACAGEPPGASAPAVRAGVYPRVCGGTLDGVPIARIARGLSPRVRGNRVVSYIPADRLGSIPACAGEPDGGGGQPVGAGVYPRVCGGTQVTMPGDNMLGGLSPRVRGNLGWADAGLHEVRSIPACAGEPRNRNGRREWPPVYPRVCGGTDRTDDYSCWVEGLSPRVRGNRCQLPLRLSSRGSIPACAGEPR